MSKSRCKRDHAVDGQNRDWAQSSELILYSKGNEICSAPAGSHTQKNLEEDRRVPVNDILRNDWFMIGDDLVAPTLLEAIPCCRLSFESCTLVRVKDDKVLFYPDASSLKLSSDLLFGSLWTTRGSMCSWFQRKEFEG